VVVIILYLTLWPDLEYIPGSWSAPFLCIWCGAQPLRDAVLNVLLFLPLGWSLRRHRSARFALVTCCLLSALIEFSQYHWIPGRDSSLRDILTNSLGGYLGVLLAEHWRLLLWPDRRTSAILALASVTTWLGILLATVALVQVRLPRSVYYGQWAPALGRHDRFQGRLDGVELNGKTISNGRRPESAAIRDILLSDSFTVDVQATDGPLPLWQAPIFALFDHSQRLILMLARSPTGFDFQIRNGMMWIGLRGQDLTMNWQPRGPDQSFRLTAGVIHGHYLIRVESEGQQVERQLAFSAAWGWSGLLPFDYAFGPEVYLLSALWLGGLLLPAGYWAGRSPSPPLVLVLALLGAAGLALLPRLSGLPPAHWSEWVSVGAGLGLGILGGRLSRAKSAPAGAPPDSPPPGA
jgi:hypothetical protein